MFSGDRLEGSTASKCTSWFMSRSAWLPSTNAGECGCIGRFRECFEYISFRLAPSSEMADSPMGYRSADALRGIMPNGGGDCSTMAGSPGYDMGDIVCEAIVADWGMGERNVLLYGVLKLEAGSGVVSGAWERKLEFEYSDGAVEAADIGYCRISKP